MQWDMLVCWCLAIGHGQHDTVQQVGQTIGSGLMLQVDICLGKCLDRAMGSHEEVGATVGLEVGVSVAAGW